MTVFVVKPLGDDAIFIVFDKLPRDENTPELDRYPDGTWSITTNPHQRGGSEQLDQLLRDALRDAGIEILSEE